MTNSIDELVPAGREVPPAPRFYAGPRVVDGVIQGVYRSLDGDHDGRIAIWDEAGTVPTALIGGLGKSSVATLMALAAASAEANVLYVEPDARHSTELARRARVALIGREAALRAPELVAAIVRERAVYAMETGADVLRMSGATAGWMVLHEEFRAVADRRRVTLAWLKAGWLMRVLAMWPVVVNRGAYESWWGDDDTRTVFSEQTIVFGTPTAHTGALMGLGDPAPRPPWWSYGWDGRGVAVQGRRNGWSERALWDWLPRDDEKVDGEPPLRRSEAFDRFFHQPHLHRIDVRAIESVLGPAVDGRWSVGPDGKHAFR